MNAPERPRRTTDTSNAEARRAITHVVGQFQGWRIDIAQYRAWLEHRFTENERQQMAARLGRIKAEVQEARVSLIVGLRNAPSRVTGHGRVTDVEKALDGVEADVEVLLRVICEAPASHGQAASDCTISSGLRS